MMIVIAPVAVVVFVPAMVVFEAAAVAVPVAGEEALAVVTRGDPTGAGVGRPGPITVMPSPTMADGVPIAVHPDKIGSGRDWPDAEHTRRRWRSDLNSNGNLAEDCACGQQEQSEQFLVHVEYFCTVCSKTQKVTY